METEAPYDTIIVGSGIAGLYVAIELLKAGTKRLAVFERQKGVGGRVHTFRQTVDGNKLQWEAGAGRISGDHHMILELLKRYKLTFSPIAPTVQYKHTYDSALEPDAFQPGIPAFLGPLHGLPPRDLETHTIRQLLTRIHGPKAEAYLIRFPYRAELDIMRADVALKLFDGEFSRSDYGVCVEGLSALIDAMRAEAEKLGAVFHMEHTLVDIQQHGLVTATFQHEEPVVVKAKRAVLALPVEALKDLKAFSKWHTMRYLKMEPLLRFYGAFPKEDGKVWYEEYSRIVTSEPLRYIIPGSADVGSMHMSYTDTQDAAYWIRKLKTDGEKKVGEEMLAELRKLIRPTIPPPYFTKAHAWDYGVTYYDPVELSKAALTPIGTMPNVHLCGESFSLRQGWMEGAVEHASMLLKKL